MGCNIAAYLPHLILSHMMSRNCVSFIFIAVIWINSTIFRNYLEARANGVDNLKDLQNVHQAEVHWSPGGQQLYHSVCRTFESLRYYDFRKKYLNKSNVIDSTSPRPPGCMMWEPRSPVPAPSPSLPSGRFTTLSTDPPARWGHPYHHPRPRHLATRAVNEPSRSFTVDSWNHLS